MNVMQHGSSFKYAKFGRGAVSLESRGNQALDLAEIGRNCPAVFATEKHESRSDRYTYVSTMDVMQALAGEGFHPYSIMQGGSKDEGKRAFTKHLIRFRSASALRNTQGSIFEVCMLGSHDGTTSTQLYGGFFRFACKNGTIFFDGEASCIKVPHKGNIVSEVIDGAYEVVNDGTRAIEHVERFKEITLNRDERMAFAEAALPLRFGTEDTKVEASALLIPHRHEDQATDLWTVQNVIQENMIRGGLSYQGQNSNGRVVRRSTRAVRSVDGNVSLNTALWLLTEKMAQIKGA